MYRVWCILLIGLVGCGSVNVGATIRVAGDTTRSAETRLRAIHTLAALKEHRVRIQRALKGLLETEDLRVARTAKRALRRVLGADRVDFAHVGVIGASVSAGFRGLALRRILRAHLKTPHRVRDTSSLFFFTDALRKGEKAVSRLIAHRPTVVFAVDFLFWFVHVSESGSRRTRRLKMGLALLERIHAPLFVGDIPSVRPVKSLVHPSQIPPHDELARYNAMIHNWARTRLHVEVIPLHEWSAPLLVGGCVSLEPHTRPVQASALMHADGLHPNRVGTRYLMRKTIRHLLRAYPRTPPGQITIPVQPGRALSRCQASEQSHHGRDRLRSDYERRSASICVDAHLGSPRVSQTGTR